MISSENRGILDTFDGQVEEVSDGHVRLRFPFDRRWYNTRGALHGGTIALYLDEAMGCVLKARFGRERRFVTVTLTVTYLRPVERGDVVAEGRIVRAGRRMGYVEAELLNEDGDLVAKGVSTVLFI